MEQIIKQIQGTQDSPAIKQFDEMGGEIVITNNLPDRSKDRVFTNGIDVTRYMSNPILVDSHITRGGIGNCIGKTIQLNRQSNMMSSVFELRPAANDFDPQSIVLLLWREKYVNASSIQFIPTVMPEENEFGGLDFPESELLEISLVLVPDNPNAIRMAYDGVTVYGKKMICGLGEVCKSGELSGDAIKSLMKDFEIKKFPVKQDLGNTEEKTSQDREVDGMIDETNEANLEMLLEEISYSAVDIMYEIFKSFNTGEITKNQARFLIEEVKILEDDEVEKLFDRGDTVSKSKTTEKLYTQAEVDEIVKKRVLEAEKATVELIEKIKAEEIKNA